jgi:hypothetical protein
MARTCRIARSAENSLTGADVGAAVGGVLIRWIMVPIIAISATAASIDGRTGRYVIAGVCIVGVRLSESRRRHAVMMRPSHTAVLLGNDSLRCANASSTNRRYLPRRTAEHGSCFTDTVPWGCVVERNVLRVCRYGAKATRRLELIESPAVHHVGTACTSGERTSEESVGRFIPKVACLFFGPVVALAQHDHHATTHGVQPDSAEPVRHMRVTALREIAIGDAARVTRLTEDVRTGIARYADVRVAMRDGYRPVFVGDTSTGAVLHYTHLWRGYAEGRRITPSEPGSLLYQKRADGTLRLVGAMYGAPEGSTPEQLDARVPLSYAKWHLHTDICLARPIWSKAKWALRSESGAPVFGPDSPIDTKEACAKVGGDFKPTVFGWMVHAMVIDNTDPMQVWGASGHAGHAAAMVGRAVERRP